jgi:drug/metabolite transporter (DMT)-like permease
MVAESLKRAGANQTAMVGTIGPIFTIALGVTLLDESVSLLQGLGAALTIVGVTLLSRKPLG